MDKPPGIFWILVGVAILILFVGIAYRVVTGSGVSVDVAGVKVDLESAQSNLELMSQQLNAKEQQLATAQQQLQARENQLASLTEQLAAHTGTTAAATPYKNQLLALRAQPAVTTTIRPIDPALLANARKSLNSASSKLTRLRAP